MGALQLRSGQALEAVPRYKPRLIVASLNVFFELFDGSVPSRFNGVSSSLVSIVVVAPLVAVGLLLSGAAMRATGEFRGYRRPVASRDMLLWRWRRRTETRRIRT